MPFIKIGDHVLRGEVTPLIGDEIILGLIRSESPFLRLSLIIMITTTVRLPHALSSPQSLRLSGNALTCRPIQPHPSLPPATSHDLPPLDLPPRHPRGPFHYRPRPRALTPGAGAGPSTTAALPASTCQRRCGPACRRFAGFGEGPGAGSSTSSEG